MCRVSSDANISGINTPLTLNDRLCVDPFVLYSKQWIYLEVWELHCNQYFIDFPTSSISLPTGWL